MNPIPGGFLRHRDVGSVQSCILQGSLQDGEQYLQGDMQIQKEKCKKRWLKKREITENEERSFPMSSREVFRMKNNIPREMLKVSARERQTDLREREEERVEKMMF